MSYTDDDVDAAEDAMWQDDVDAAEDAMWQLIDMVDGHRPVRGLAKAAVAAVAPAIAARALREAADDCAVEFDAGKYLVVQVSGDLADLLRAEQVSVEAMEAEDESTLTWVSRKTGKQVDP